VSTKLHEKRCSNCGDERRNHWDGPCNRVLKGRKERCGCRKFDPIHVRRVLMYRRLVLRKRQPVVYCLRCWHHRKNHWNSGCKRQAKCGCGIFVEAYEWSMKFS